MALEKQENLEKKSSPLNKVDSYDSKEVNDLKESIGQTVEGSEGMEFVEALGNVSEKVNDSIRENQGTSVKKTVKTDDRKVVDPEEIKARLLKDLPNKRELKKQIVKEIQSEIKYLHKQAIKMSRKSGNVNYFEVANMLRKIRELRGILNSLVKASMDNLKALWLRFVHGIM